MFSNNLGELQIAHILHRECKGLAVGDSKVCDITPTPAFEAYKGVHLALISLDPGLMVEWKGYNFDLTITVHRIT